MSKSGAGRRLPPSGGAPAGNQNSTIHGIYGKYLTEEELSLDIKIGTVDAELRLTRVQLRRALSAQKAANNEPELDEVVEQAGDMTTTRRTFRRRDYMPIIDRLLGRIESLERTRAELFGLGGDDEEIFNDLNILPDESIPENPVL